MLSPQSPGRTPGAGRRQVHLSAPIVDYCHAILVFTRRSERFVYGLSPRAGLGLLRAAKAWALLAGRDYVLPEDVQAVLPACLPHRLADAGTGPATSHEDIAELHPRRGPGPLRPAWGSLAPRLRRAGGVFDALLRRAPCDGQGVARIAARQIYILPTGHGRRPWAWS